MFVVHGSRAEQGRAEPSRAWHRGTAAESTAGQATAQHRGAEQTDLRQELNRAPHVKGGLKSMIKAEQHQ